MKDVWSPNTRLRLQTNEIASQTISGVGRAVSITSGYSRANKMVAVCWYYSNRYKAVAPSAARGITQKQFHSSFFIFLLLCLYLSTRLSRFLSLSLSALRSLFLFFCFSFLVFFYLFISSFILLSHSLALFFLYLLYFVWFFFRSLSLSVSRHISFVMFISFSHFSTHIGPNVKCVMINEITSFRVIISFF